MKNLALILLLLAACTPAGKPSAAPSPKTIPTPMSTPVPPLVAHEWSQSEPLITYSNKCAMCPGLAILFPADFTLLPSGDLYLRRRIGNSPDEVILTTTLSRQATCHLLNSIDQAGFFDYDPSSYFDAQTVMDAGYTVISVQAWRANSVSLYNLGGYLYEETGNPASCLICRRAGYSPIPPAIRYTYQVLDQYWPPLGSLHFLKPERLGVWLYGPPGTARTNDAIEWPLKSYSLAAAAPTGPDFPLQDHPDMILTGEDATQVYDALGETLNVYRDLKVREGDKQYGVFARPLLPNEFNSSPLPKVSLSCSPSDGWFQKR